MEFGLPTSLTVNGREEPIRYEFTAVLDAISALDDPDLKTNEKIMSFLFIIYEDFDEFGKDDYQPAFDAAMKFINNGDDEEDDHRSRARMIDFEQDYKIMIAAVNRVAGHEIRNDADVHWWTFLGWLMEIGESTYGTVLSIRKKLRDGTKLEKWEQDFYAKNRRMITIREKLTEEEKENERRLNALLD